MSHKTALHDNHIALGAKMAPFHGWDMPLHYGSQMEEHHQVRHDAGMFDVSHMTVVDILGAGGRQFLRRLLTNDVDQLEHAGRALYSCMCNEQGGIIDDLILYQRSPVSYRLISNAGTRDVVMSWLHDKARDFSVGIQERTDLAIIAIQGPNAISKSLSILTPSQADSISTLTPFESVEVDTYFFARTGYTGEDGLEIILPQDEAPELWSALQRAGVTPCGLAARDTLRLEAGLLLSGQDMNESTTPLESGLGWTIKWQPEDRNFIGMGALLSQKQKGPKYTFVGLTLEDKGVMRPGQHVIVEGSSGGIITSGTYSPTLEKSIALARLPISVKPGQRVSVDIRGKKHAAVVGKPRFVKHGQAI